MRSKQNDFQKYDALGNDYLVIDPNHCDVELTPDTVKLLCNRHYGIGADGILAGPFSYEKYFGLRIFNSDGSECEKSGNGLRIFARYLIDAGYVASSSFFVKLLQSGQQVPIECMDKIGGKIKVDMGVYSLMSSDFPSHAGSRRFFDEALSINGTKLRACCVNISNPHCVILEQPVTAAVAKSIGPLICEHPFFPNRINVQFAEIISRGEIHIEIWERGAGYTLASGSSACAAAIACFELGLIDRKIIGSMPGGEVEIEICEDKHVLLTGPVRSVAHGTFGSDLEEKLTNKRRTLI